MIKSVIEDKLHQLNTQTTLPIGLHTCKSINWLMVIRSQCGMHNLIVSQSNTYSAEMPKLWPKRVQRKIKNTKTVSFLCLAEILVKTFLLTFKKAFSTIWQTYESCKWREKSFLLKWNESLFYFLWKFLFSFYFLEACDLTVFVILRGMYLNAQHA